MHARLLLFLLLLTGSASCAWARLGENEADIVTRYGKPTFIIHHTWGDEKTYSFNGFTINVSMISGVSVGELYRVAPGQKINDEMSAQLLSANSEGFFWKEIPKDQFPKDISAAVNKMWQKPDGSTAALADNSFEFKATDLLNAEQAAAATQKPVAPSAQGF
jgi:hypothetical protein